jgi:hypothetical protein
VDYSLFDGGDDGVDIREGGEATEGDSGSVSPSNLLWNNLCFYVSCFLAVSNRDRPGGIYIGI